MQAFAPSRPALPSSALLMLLARYVDGQIADVSWKKLMRVFDTAGMSSTERLALAKFVNDLFSERRDAAFNVPKLKETRDLLSDIRVA